MDAYIIADEGEDYKVIADLTRQLEAESISYRIVADQSAIHSEKPFIFFRNPYLRYNNYSGILDFIKKNPVFPRILAQHEVIALNPSLPAHHVEFSLNVAVTIHRPKWEPLPILLMTHRRPTYLRLALNSLLYSLRHEPHQKIYIVGSQVDTGTETILKDLLLDNRVDVVLSDQNLGYAVGNFGLKFFGLAKFIHFEDDFILPESTFYHLPYWTRQLNYRSHHSKVVALRTSLENTPSDALGAHPVSSKYLNQATMWATHEIHPGDRPPFGGNGLVIDSSVLYGTPIEPPYYCKTDMDYLKSGGNITLANVPVYHTGANQVMDRYTQGAYMARFNRVPHPERYQRGVNLRTGETKVIDLETPI